uniref:Uncharacterized protein n=1 Tax=Arundo donax TaxID=35708 RepID=A0A0A8YRJ2_ARUDO
MKITSCIPPVYPTLFSQKHRPQSSSYSVIPFQ